MASEPLLSQKYGALQNGCRLPACTSYMHIYKPWGSLQALFFLDEGLFFLLGFQERVHCEAPRPKRRQQQQAPGHPQVGGKVQPAGRGSAEQRMGTDAALRSAVPRIELHITGPGSTGTAAACRRGMQERHASGLPSQQQPDMGQPCP